MRWEKEIEGEAQMSAIVPNQQYIQRHSRLSPTMFRRLRHVLLAPCRLVSGAVSAIATDTSDAAQTSLILRLLAPIPAAVSLTLALADTGDGGREPLLELQGDHFEAIGDA